MGSAGSLAHKVLDAVRLCTCLRQIQRQPHVANALALDRAQVAIYSRGQRKVYAFDRAFDGGCGQAHVYEDTKSLIRSVLDGGGQRTSLAGPPSSHCPIPPQPHSGTIFTPSPTRDRHRAG